ncbi:TlpA family protein disulfide reductase [Lacinutrix chionoecetis]
MKFNVLHLLAVFALVLSSCKDDAQDINDTKAYIGGEIINPSSKYLVLKKSGKVIDTIFLDKQNRFSYSISDFEPGLYSFYDGREFQNILIEHQDSLKLRLNTIDFDESLVYTGKGGKENNFLMEMYLLNQQEDDKILGLGQKDAREFDSIYRLHRDRKLKKLEQFKLKNETSELFDEIAEGSINYEYYSHKELYPLANYKISELDAFNNLPEDFYDYRDDVDYNNTNLKDYSPYLSFLRYHFNNLALQNHFEHSKDSAYNKLDVHYNIDKLNIIDEKVSNEEIKNGLLRHVIAQFISVSKNTEDYDEILQAFKEKSTNAKDIEKATRFVNSYKRLKPGNKIPPVILLNKDNKEVNIQKLIKMPTVIYFWSKRNKNHFISSHKRAKELNVKYPEFNFIAVNSDSISYQEQVTILKRHDLRIHNEYRFKFPEQSIDSLSVRPIVKVFILNKKGQIENAKANMFNIAFEQELLGIINQ